MNLSSYQHGFRTNRPCLTNLEMMLELISRNFDRKSPKVVKRFYTAFVRLHLEYAILFWSPNYIKDQNLLERVHRRATKLIPTLRNLSYEEQLEQLDMFTLYKRRIRGNITGL